MPATMIMAETRRFIAMLLFSSWVASVFSSWFAFVAGPQSTLISHLAVTTSAGLWADAHLTVEHGPLKGHLHDFKVDKAASRSASEHGGSEGDVTSHWAGRKP